MKKAILLVTGWFYLPWAGAAEVCIVSPYFYDGSKTVISCSNIGNGKGRVSNETLPVALKERLESGFQIAKATPITSESEKTVTGSVVYTLVKP